MKTPSSTIKSSSFWEPSVFPDLPPGPLAHRPTGLSRHHRWPAMGATMCHDVPWGRLQGLGVELNVYSLLLNIYH